MDRGHSQQSHAASTAFDGVRVISAVPITVIAISAAEALQVPWRTYVHRPWLLPQTFVLATALAVTYLVGPVVYALAFTAVEALRARGRLSSREHVGLHLLCAVGVALIVYYTLARYEPFHGHPPFVAGSIGLVAALVWSGLTFHGPRMSSRWMTRAVRFGALLAGGMGFLLAYVVNYNVYRNVYPMLHLAVLQVAALGLHMAVVHALSRFPRLRLRRRWARRGLWSAAAVVALAAAVVGLGARAGLARSLVLGHTLVGQSRSVFADYHEQQREFSVSPSAAGQAEHRFLAASNLPPLPTHFELRDHNILLVVIDCLRFDQTSMAQGDWDTTPNIAKLVDRGAFSFSRAYSPSSGTFHSMASMLTMTFPAAVSLETWKKAWHGQVYEDNVTVPELLQAADFETFWIGHDFNYAFRYNLLGFDQGFDYRRLFYQHGRRVGTTDRRIIQHAISYTRKLHRQRARYFGWVFLINPHAPWGSHYEDWPKAEFIERYRQEARFSDEQLGKLIRQLDASGELDNTIIIVTGDHGDEFYEHGGLMHKKTVYNEVTHVPLVIWIPGVDGEVVDAPTSLTYVFPWLLLHTEGAPRSAALERITYEIEPMMRATDDAVVVELIGHGRMVSALVYPEHKISYDHISTLTEVYDLVADPGEQVDLSVYDPTVAQEYAGVIDSYLDVRSAIRQFVLRPERESRRTIKRPPMPRSFQPRRTRPQEALPPRRPLRPTRSEAGR